MTGRRLVNALPMPPQPSPGDHARVDAPTASSEADARCQVARAFSKGPSGTQNVPNASSIAVASRRSRLTAPGTSAVQPSSASVMAWCAASCWSMRRSNVTSWTVPTIRFGVTPLSSIVENVTRRRRTVPSV